MSNTNTQQTTTPTEEGVTLKGVWRLLLRLIGVTLSTAEKAVVMVDNLADSGVALTGMAKDAAEDLRIKSAAEAQADFQSDLERINAKRQAKGLGEVRAESQGAAHIQDHL